MLEAIVHIVSHHYILSLTLSSTYYGIFSWVMLQKLRLLENFRICNNIRLDNIQLLHVLPSQLTEMQITIKL
jgi:hypothetical protein